MAWFKDKLNELRNRPYGERVRILKIIIVVIIILMIGLWILSMNFRKKTSNSGQDIFSPVIQNIKNLKNPKP
ncbi:MAG: hypothetical protein Q8R08_04380 [bacterium]|nr:hypothetical protein [bacterium]